MCCRQRTSRERRDAGSACRQCRCSNVFVSVVQHGVARQQPRRCRWCVVAAHGVEKCTLDRSHRALLCVDVRCGAVGSDVGGTEHGGERAVLKRVQVVRGLEVVDPLNGQVPLVNRAAAATRRSVEHWHRYLPPTHSPTHPRTFTPSFSFCVVIVLTTFLL